MVKLSDAYLKAAKREALEAELHTTGYIVDAAVGPGFDFVATRGPERLGFAVHTRTDRSVDLQELQEHARAQGVTEVRLVLVNPPQVTAVRVEGLPEALRAYLAQHVPPDLQRPDLDPEMLEVGDVEIEEVAISRQGYRIAGWSVLAVRASGWDRAALAPPVTVDVPFQFAVHLTPDLHIAEAEYVRVDASALAA